MFIHRENGITTDLDGGGTEHSQKQMFCKGNHNISKANRQHILEARLQDRHQSERTGKDRNKNIQTERRTLEQNK